VARTPFNEELPGDLQGIAARLTEGRTEVSDLRLDELKRRALAQAASQHGRHSSFRSRVIALVTTVALLGGSGAALAISRLDQHPNTYGGAADAQYKPGKGCGNKHPHQRRGECKKHKHSVKAAHHRRAHHRRAHRRRHAAPGFTG
jgi:hypothetical protein